MLTRASLHTPCQKNVSFTDLFAERQIQHMSFSMLESENKSICVHTRNGPNNRFSDSTWTIQNRIEKKTLLFFFCCFFLKILCVPVTPFGVFVCWVNDKREQGGETRLCSLITHSAAGEEWLCFFSPALFLSLLRHQNFHFANKVDFLKEGVPTCIHFFFYYSLSTFARSEEMPIHHWPTGL